MDDRKKTVGVYDRPPQRGPWLRVGLPLVALTVALALYFWIA